MPIDELLALLVELRAADIRLAMAQQGSERAAAMREVRRLECLAFAHALRPEPEPTRWTLGSPSNRMTVEW